MSGAPLEYIPELGGGKTGLRRAGRERWLSRHLEVGWETRIKRGVAAACEVFGLFGNTAVVALSPLSITCLSTWSPDRATPFEC